MKSTVKAGLSILGLSAALAFASPAFAQRSPDMGFYIGGALGQAEHSDQCTGAGGVTCDDKDTAWKIFGGYQFNKFLAVEGAYTNFGEASATSAGVTVTDEATAFEVVAVGMYPIIDKLSVYGKLGFFRGEIDRSSNSPAVATGTNSQTDLTFGVGLRYNITNNVAVRAEWQRYTDVGEITDIDVISIGALFKF
jgi:opacity protein-like surface antigen